jgi:hypothetical protein
MYLAIFCLFLFFSRFFSIPENKVEDEEYEDIWTICADTLISWIYPPEKEVKMILAEIKYEDKYLEKSKSMERNVLSEEEKKDLKKKILMEYSPLGNVLMFYNHDKNSFSYYSDHCIPYRFLETIGRKYIITFQCASLFYFIDEELEKLNKLQQTEQPVSSQNKLFARFKQYNKNSLSQSGIKPPSNNIQKIQPINMKQIPIKENANRYTYEGKLGNYSFLQKIDKKLVNKKLKISYSDFKTQR